MRSNRRLWVVALLFSLVGTLAGGTAVYFQHDRATTAEENEQSALQTGEQIAGDALDLADQIDAACALEDGDPDRELLRDSGLCRRANQVQKSVEDAPVASPTSRPAAPGPRGPQGPAPTLLQVNAAVRSQIGDALEAVCDGDCTGAAGADGADGADGATGAQGEPGNDGAPGATGQRGEPGQTGAKGDRGEPGADAPRITFIECDGMTPFTLTFGLSDGTTYDVSCGFLEPIPEPAPEPEPEP